MATSAKDLAEDEEGDDCDGYPHDRPDAEPDDAHPLALGEGNEGAHGGRRFVGGAERCARHDGLGFGFLVKLNGDGGEGDAVGEELEAAFVAFDFAANPGEFALDAENILEFGGAVEVILVFDKK